MSHYTFCRAWLMHVACSSGWKTCDVTVVGYSRSRKVSFLFPATAHECIVVDRKPTQNPCFTFHFRSYKKSVNIFEKEIKKEIVYSSPFFFPENKQHCIICCFRLILKLPQKKKYICWLFVDYSLVLFHNGWCCRRLLAGCTLCSALTLFLVLE